MGGSHARGSARRQAHESLLPRIWPHGEKMKSRHRPSELAAAQGGERELYPPEGGEGTRGGVRHHVHRMEGPHGGVSSWPAHRVRWREGKGLRVMSAGGMGGAVGERGRAAGGREGATPPGGRTVCAAVSVFRAVQGSGRRLMWGSHKVLRAGGGRNDGV